MTLGTTGKNPKGWEVVGDFIGDSTFSRRHLLGLMTLGVMNTGVAQCANSELQKDNNKRSSAPEEESQKSIDGNSDSDK